MTRDSSTYRGIERCMIFKPLTRKLDDGCVDCGASTVSCAATSDVERRRCCDTCDHGGE